MTETVPFFRRRWVIILLILSIVAMFFIPFIIIYILGFLLFLIPIYIRKMPIGKYIMIPVFWPYYLVKRIILDIIKYRKEVSEMKN